MARRITVSKVVTFDEVNSITSRPTLSSEIEEDDLPSNDLISTPRTVTLLPPAQMQLRSDSKGKLITTGESPMNHTTKSNDFLPRKDLLINESSVELSITSTKLQGQNGKNNSTSLEVMKSQENQNNPVFTRVSNEVTQIPLSTEATKSQVDSKTVSINSTTIKSLSMSPQQPSGTSHEFSIGENSSPSAKNSSLSEFYSEPTLEAAIDQFTGHPPRIILLL